MRDFVFAFILFFCETCSVKTLTLKNRKDKNVVVALDEAADQKGLVFILHGLGGFKEQDQIRVMAESFVEHGYTSVRIDSTNGFGESDGGLEDVSVTSNYEDLEDVIARAKDQSWYREPFVLAGHSMGSMCVVLFAEKHPERVLALAPISALVSGALWMRSVNMQKVMGMWEETKWFIQDSRSKPGAIKRVPWSFVIDTQKYDILPKAKFMKMPVLLAVGEHDPATPVEHQKKFFKALPEGKKELHIIKGAFHTFRSNEHLSELKSIFDRWTSGL
ncbi:MAG: hypothetical protein A3B30_02890 [Candidatus Komeilibacteria bacterium RIFCSPLOWO2_01_FULL_52_15]|uniref:Serine aminopeptidase S33 domain-containing protein n=2 Tax=Candidatus Komeiliibacteriota TaxID=1817908 RepID=A0A1G2BQU5_9BACT|nr:MAG: hypothetical protein A2677_02365 [Candidatus Komeilibacteria bacterium RIFCSPHIGHO2_01_FULL_52_14]OGY91471.1 MAG: hypothetical protein A3B30_02890 [Candidatus Komeilibacteria bacterium RIFCSPLOWO2_01_FULL_52_15]